MLNKINGNKFLKSTLILLFGGLFGKIVGFILRIIITRNLGTTNMGIYSLLNPTSTLLSVLAVFSYSNAISKIVSEDKTNNKRLLISISQISIIINIIFITIIILLSKHLSYSLIKNNTLYYPIIFLSLTMPFISISSIIKGYFWGKQNMFPYMLSNFLEQVIRLIIISFLIEKTLEYSPFFTICFISVVNMIGELFSQLIMIIYFPKNKLTIKDFKLDLKIIKEVLSFCIPVTFSKILSSISYFLEPIILTTVLLYVGYSEDYIIYEYGIVNAYSLSILLMPQFFTQNMATALIPELSKQYKNNNIKLCIKRIKQIITLSVLIGLISTIIITINPTFFLKILYNTNEGIDYIRLLSPFTILFYIEYPLNNALQALGKSKETFNITIKTSIIRILSLITLSLLKIGMYSLIISIIINLIVSTYLYYKEIKKILII